MPQRILVILVAKDAGGFEAMLGNTQMNCTINTN